VQEVHQLVLSIWLCRQLTITYLIERAPEHRQYLLDKIKLSRALNEEIGNSSKHLT
jgi:hypothetical protein